MLRFLQCALALIVFEPATRAFAQIQPRPYETSNNPSGGFTLSLRVLGKARVTFHDVGTIASTLEVGDMTSEISRFYDDGVVYRDNRTANDGSDIPDDGRTGTWVYGYASQVVSDQSGIAFHRYSTQSDGGDVTAEAGPLPGLDMEYSAHFGHFGRRFSDKSSSLSWGGMAGFAFAGVNAKTKSRAHATLITLTDVYSLDGAPPPPAPYSAPSSTTVTDSDGNSHTVFTTTLLENRPYSRTETVEPGGADIDGFWQMRGAYYSFRAGTWLRWKLNPRFSVRASVGACLAYTGVQLRYDEMLVNRKMLTQVRVAERLQEPLRETYYGTYASLDAEWWFQPTTGFFVSLTHEKYSKQMQVTVGKRTAEINFSSGAGFRIGISKLF